MHWLKYSILPVKVINKSILQVALRAVSLWFLTTCRIEQNTLIKSETKRISHTSLKKQNLCKNTRQISLLKLVFTKEILSDPKIDNYGPRIKTYLANHFFRNSVNDWRIYSINNKIVKCKDYYIIICLGLAFEHSWCFWNIF